MILQTTHGENEQSSPEQTHAFQMPGLVRLSFLDSGCRFLGPVCEVTPRTHFLILHKDLDASANVRLCATNVGKLKQFWNACKKRRVI